jgi:N-acetylmuramic acid 6-phosphate etherase
MLDRLSTEKSLPGSLQLDRMTTVEILQLMNSADAEIAEAVHRELPRIGLAIDAIAETLGRNGHLAYIGAGASGRLGVLDASECPPTFGVNPDLVRGIIAGGERALARASEASEDDPVRGAADLEASGFNKDDVVVGISASGRTPYVLGAVQWARQIGAVTCGISCAPGSELSKAVDYPMEPAPGPEVIAGSTRLRAGTATKMVLNMISTAVMIRLGHVYGNLMVNVQPSNFKLEDRARRIVAQATGVDYDRASQLLEAGGRNVRTAIVMGKRNLNRTEAERLLENVGGRLAEALK